MTDVDHCWICTEFYSHDPLNAHRVVFLECGHTICKTCFNKLERDDDARRWFHRGACWCGKEAVRKTVPDDAMDTELKRIMNAENEREDKLKNGVVVETIDPSFHILPWDDPEGKRLASRKCGSLNQKENPFTFSKEPTFEFNVEKRDGKWTIVKRLMPGPPPNASDQMYQEGLDQMCRPSKGDPCGKCFEKLIPYFKTDMDVSFPEIMYRYNSIMCDRCQPIFAKVREFHPLDGQRSWESIAQISRLMALYPYVVDERCSTCKRLHCRINHSAPPSPAKCMTEADDGTDDSTDDDYVPDLGGIDEEVLEEFFENLSSAKEDEEAAAAAAAAMSLSSIATSWKLDGAKSRKSFCNKKKSCRACKRYLKYIQDKTGKTRNPGKACDFKPADLRHKKNGNTPKKNERKRKRAAIEEEEEEDVYIDLTKV